ncbi:MAG: protease modulator HflC [Nitrospinota bacterium]
MQKALVGVVVAIVLLLILANSVFYTVGEWEQAVVTRLGKPVGGVKGPGLHWRMPFVEKVHPFERRILEYDSNPTEVITADKKTLIVDNFSRWRIVAPLLFLQTVQNEDGAQARLDDIIYSELRVELARHLFHDIISEKRGEMMERVTGRSAKKALEYGIQVVDVRIKRADLPRENEQAVYGRMKAERERIARQYRSEGKEEALKIRSQTDKERTILLAEAYEKEQKLKGEGDALAIKITAAAFSQEPEFYAFLKSLEAYRTALKDKTTLILPPDSEFLSFLGASEGRAPLDTARPGQTARAQPKPPAGNPGKKTTPKEGQALTPR